MAYEKSYEKLPKSDVTMAPQAGNHRTFSIAAIALPLISARGE